ncbi:MAG: hypothetical protein JWO58_599 [Chitinophagaceae bacterium]|nr:hypothetical protein [Chitinophagaceae bacterium]
MKKHSLIFLLLTFGFLACQNSQSTTETTSVDSSTTNNVTNEAGKSDAEVNAELIEKGVDVGTTLIENVSAAKQQRDSIRAANRKEVWIFQIGGNQSSPKAFEELYHQLSGSLTNLYLFKESKHSYYLIKKDNCDSQQELLDKQNEVEAAIQQAGATADIRVINLTSYCELKDDVQMDDNVKLKGKDRLDCYTCK